MGGKVAMACALQRSERATELCVLDMAPTSYETETCASWRVNRELIAALAVWDRVDSSLLGARRGRAERTVAARPR